MLKDITVNERLAIMETKFNGLSKTVEVGFEDLKGDIKTLSGKFDCLDKKYVTKSEFTPVRIAVYSIVGAAGMAVVGSLVSLVVK